MKHQNTMASDDTYYLVQDSVIIKRDSKSKAKTRKKIKSQTIRRERRQPIEED